MRIEAITNQNRILNIRRVFIVAGVVGMLAYFTGISANVPFLAVSGLVAFLGITNFGRQCPLLLVLRRVVQRAKT